MRNLSRHANALAQRGMRANRFTDVHRVCNQADDYAHDWSTYKNHSASAQPVSANQAFLLV
ncbi:hypothetical protein [Polaromonas sp.]|uniref:hypothetical protein n=1 Tax=Polaromonas sp. TaxID=1869339 RepID=UPI0024892796|nr:hypothetical protein [Polaromonas sp.]MDI1340436.1 hypothetical protein [Polaromonas sp.]